MPTNPPSELAAWLRSCLSEHVEAEIVVDQVCATVIKEQINTRFFFDKTEYIRQNVKALFRDFPLGVKFTVEALLDRPDLYAAWSAGSRKRTSKRKAVHVVESGGSTGTTRASANTHVSAVPQRSAPSGRRIVKAKHPLPLASRRPNTTTKARVAPDYMSEDEEPVISPAKRPRLPITNTGPLPPLPTAASYVSYSVGTAQGPHVGSSDENSPPMGGVPENMQSGGSLKSKGTGQTLIPAVEKKQTTSTRTASTGTAPDGSTARGGLAITTKTGPSPPQAASSMSHSVGSGDKKSPPAGGVPGTMQSGGALKGAGQTLSPVVEVEERKERTNSLDLSTSSACTGTAPDASRAGRGGAMASPIVQPGSSKWDDTSIHPKRGLLTSGDKSLDTFIAATKDPGLLRRCLKASLAPHRRGKIERAIEHLTPGKKRIAPDQDGPFDTPPKFQLTDVVFYTNPDDARFCPNGKAVLAEVVMRMKDGQTYEIHLHRTDQKTFVNEKHLIPCRTTKRKKTVRVPSNHPSAAFASPDAHVDTALLSVSDDASCDGGSYMPTDAVCPTVRKMNSVLNNAKPETDDVSLMSMGSVRGFECPACSHAGLNVSVTSAAKLNSHCQKCNTTKKETRAHLDYALHGLPNDSKDWTLSQRNFVENMCIGIRWNYAGGSKRNAPEDFRTAYISNFTERDLTANTLESLNMRRFIVFVGKMKDMTTTLSCLDVEMPKGRDHWC